MMTLIIAGWIFGIAVFAAGVVNTFWGNDPGFGVFILLLSFAYFPPTSNILSAISERSIGFPIPKVAKIVLGIFIVWATLDVGELFDKIELMMMDLKYSILSKESLSVLAIRFRPFFSFQTDSESFGKELQATSDGWL